MCGIASVIFYKSEISYYDRIRVIQLLFPKALLNTEERGEDATGIFQVNSNGDWMMAKKGQKASEWLLKDSVDDPVCFSDFTDSWLQHTSELKAVVGHCRKATTGSFGRDNDDNHPFACQVDADNAILGVHNGTLKNHEVIFKNLTTLGSPLPRIGKVDSESAFHLLWYLSEGGTRRWTAEDLRKFACRVDGTYAIVGMNSKFPDQVITARSGRPMDYTLIHPLNVVVAISEKKHLNEALLHYNTMRKFYDSTLPELTTITRSLRERGLRIFDLNAPFPDLKDSTTHSNALDGLCSAYGDIMQGHPYTYIVPEWTISGPHLVKPDKSTPKALPAPKADTAAEKEDTGTPPRSITIDVEEDADENLVAEVDASLGEVADYPANYGSSSHTIANAPAATVAEKEEEGENKTPPILAYGRNLGLCPHYKSLLALSNALGMKLDKLSGLSPLDLVNAVSELSFLQGYALGAVEVEDEAERLKKRVSQQEKAITRMTKKQCGAQKRLGRFKQIILANQILSECNYASTPNNLKIVLKSILDVSSENYQRIVSEISTSLHSKKAERLVREGIAQLKEGGPKKQEAK